MISIYVTAQDTDGTQILGEHYEFETVPRIGERVILDNRGGLDGPDSATPLIVTDVINFAVPKGDIMNPISFIKLTCAVIG